MLKIVHPDQSYMLVHICVDFAIDKTDSSKVSSDRDENISKLELCSLSFRVAWDRHELSICEVKLDTPTLDVLYSDEVRPALRIVFSPTS